MKKLIIAYSIFLFACRQSTPQNEVEIPDALEEHSSFTLSKRSGEDLVDKIYDDLAAKTPELNRLEQDFKKLENNRGDSLEDFQVYDAKNEEYYSSAKRHFETIEDSVFRKKIAAQVAQSIAAYELGTAQQQQLLKDIDASKVSFNDLHEAIKILRTLPVIASYQRNNLPPIAPLSAINKRYQNLVQQADTLLKK